MKKITRTDGMLVAVILISVILRVLAVLNHEIMYDGTAYAALGSSVANNGEFYMDWGTLWPPNGGPGYSHWLAPLYPTYLAVYYVIFGYSGAVTKTANLIASLGAMAVAYLVTSSLFDRRGGLMAAAFIGANPVLILLTAYGFSENIVLITFSLALWAMLKGTEDPHYILPAGILAALGYLSRSNVGYFFLIAAFIGLAWRFLFMRWRVFSDRSYITAAVVFGFVFLLWSGRNLYRFGWPNWETNPMITEIWTFSLNYPGELLYVFLFKIILFTSFFFTAAAFFLPEIIRDHRDILSDQRLSGAYLGLILPYIIAVFFMSAYHVWLAHNGMAKPIFWEEGARYVIIADLPLLWIVLSPRKDTHERKRTFSNSHIGSAIIGVISLAFINPLRGIAQIIGTVMPDSMSYVRRFTVLLGIFLLLSCAVSVSVDRPAYVKASQDLNTMLVKGDSLALDMGPNRTTKYIVHPYLTNLDTPPEYYQPNSSATYIMSWTGANYANYTKIGTYYSDEGIAGIGDVPFVGKPGSERQVVTLWKRNLTSF